MALGKGSSRPSKVAVVHGEPEVATSFAATLRKQLSWNAFVAEYEQKIDV